jgi:N-acetylmuramoyl-L-alanine amidase
MIVKNIKLICFFSLVLVLMSFNPERKSAYRVKRIVIDAGHGGRDPGAVGSFSKEKDVALAIALKLGNIINENLKDVEVIYTRKTDVFIPLYERSDIANKNDADLFISIHANAQKSGNNAFGTETYIMGPHASERNLDIATKENSVILLEDNYEEKYEGFDPSSPESYILFSLYQNAYLKNSLRLADLIEDQFKNRVRRHSRGVKQAGLLVLWRSAMPSVLVEVGFMSNPIEEKYLNNDLNQTYLASAIFRAIRDYKQELEAVN